MTRTTAFFFLMAFGSLAGAAFAARMDRGAGLPPFEKPVAVQYAAQDMGAVFMGSRRIGGDLVFLQMLQYLSSQKPVQEDQHQEPFPRLQEYGRRILSLNPYDHYSMIFTAGVLAFIPSINRPQEALELLTLAAQHDPTYWRYRLYAGAIAYRKSADVDKAIQLLEEAFLHEDCPSMIKNILAVMHKKKGNYLRAAEIYLHILESGRDINYREKAERELKIFKEKGLI